MACSSGFSDCKPMKAEHEETALIARSDQMAAKEIDEKPQIEDLDEKELKLLLDEAMDYKNPRDANDKSDTFKQLLKNVTEEDNKRNECYLGPFGLKQSNSLQNLLDDSHYQSISHQSHTSGKKHHQQRRKNSTSVSARRLEGGSLPIDMHHSSAAVQSPPDQPFLSEYKNKKRKEKQQQKETVIDIGEDETDEKKLMQRHFEAVSAKEGISSSYPHDGIEMKPYYTNKVEMELQDNYHNNPPHIITTMSSIASAGGLTTSSHVTKMAPSMANSESVDKKIDLMFLEKSSSYQQKQQLQEVSYAGSTINQSNNIVLANRDLQFPSSSSGRIGAIDSNSLALNSTYPSVSSVTNSDKLSAKTYQNKVLHDPSAIPAIISSGPVIASSYPGTAVGSSKEGKSKQKRTSKSERNEITIDVKAIQGFRGDEGVEDLLKFIDGDGGKKQKGLKNGIVANNHTANDHLMTAEEKKRKMAAKNKEKVNKLKKSNSMDELCSTGRQEQQEEKSPPVNSKLIEDVTLRSKSSNIASGAKKGDKNDKSQQKRNERRSWGTEGLWTEANDHQDEQQEVESSGSSSGVPSELSPDSLPSSVEPAAVVSETEFHVVTKKRKVKRKSDGGGDLSKAANHLQSYKRDGHMRLGTKNYNDRDDNSKHSRNSKPSNHDGNQSSGKNRRKSTSSMPPSDDDCDSDGNDSVQSLPIGKSYKKSSQTLPTTVSASETTTSSGGKAKKGAGQLHQQQQQKPAAFSYADIAKTNARTNGTNVTASTEKWPSITASSSSNNNNSNNASHQINDPFSIANFDVASSLKSQPPHPQQLKAAAAITSSMSFPELVENNNNKNKQLSSSSHHSSQPPAEHASNGDTINTTDKPINGLDVPRAFDTNNNNSNDDRINNNQKISYSQSLLESHNNHPEVDSNGNNVKADLSTSPPVVVNNKAVLTKSKSVDHNNLSSIEHYPALEKTHATMGEVFAKPPVTFETYASKSKQKQIKPTELIKQTKKDRLKKSSSVQNPHYPQQNVILNCRPAVIILNDSIKSSDADCGITFGFDINEHLLFGQQNGDEAGIMDVRLENNNNCDITNTNLSSNLTNQGVEAYESFSAAQHIVIGDSHIMTLSQSSPEQHQQPRNAALDSSNHSSNNDIGYMSSSLITTSTTSPPTIKSTSSMPSDDQFDSMPVDVGSPSEVLDVKRALELENCDLLLPQFVQPEPIKFNHEEIFTFVSGEWTKVYHVANFFSQ